MNNRELTVIAVKLLALFIAVSFINLATGAAVTWGVSLFNATSSGPLWLIAFALGFIGLLPPFLAFKLWRYAKSISISVAPDSLPAATLRLETLIVMALGIWLTVSCIPELLSAVGSLLRYLEVKHRYAQGIISSEPLFPSADLLWCVGNLIQLSIGIWLLCRPTVVVSHLPGKQHGL